MESKSIKRFSLMTKQELKDYLWARYKKEGVSALSYSSIKKEKGLYFQLYSKGLKIRDFIEEFGLKDEYHAAQSCWSWEKVINETTKVVENHGYLPPAQWFQQNKMSSLVYATYNLGKDWNDLRAHFNSYENSTFVKSRNGMRWRSHPEASLSNFLYSRGVVHKVGEKYPDEFIEYGSSKYGYYDLHFKASDNTWIDVEVWGDKPNGHNEEGYKAQRKAKEEFNESNPKFLGMHYLKCFDEKGLEEILVNFIGIIKPFIFEKNTDKIIQPTHWSNSDELIEYCSELAKKQPNGVFPTEEWLRKRGKWKDREGPAYNTVSIYIKTWIGGVRILRKILNQEESSTISWSKELLLKEYKKWFDKYGLTPGQSRSRAIKGKDTLTSDEIKRATNIATQVQKYFGSIENINNILEISNTQKTRWNQQVILEETARLFELYSLTPHQMVKISNADKTLFKISEKDHTLAKQLANRITTYFSSIEDIYSKLNITSSDIRKVRKVRKIKMV